MGRKLKGGVGLKNIVPFLVLTSLKPVESGFFSKSLSTVTRLGKAVITNPLFEGTWSSPREIESILTTGLTTEEVNTINQKIKLNQNKINDAIQLVKGNIPIDTKPKDIKQLIINELEEYNKNPTEFVKPDDVKDIRNIIGIEQNLRSYLTTIANELGKPVGLSSEAIIVYTLFIKYKGEGKLHINYNTIKPLLVYLIESSKNNSVLTIQPTNKLEIPEQQDQNITYIVPPTKEPKPELYDKNKFSKISNTNLPELFYIKEGEKMFPSKIEDEQLVKYEDDGPMVENNYDINELEIYERIPELSKGGRRTRKRKSKHRKTKRR